MAENATYTGRLLRVDLSSGRIAPEEIAPEVLRGCLGGCALGARYLYDEVPPELDWSDPGNRLMILGGPLTGTPVASTGGVTVCAKGALTNGAASTQAQGVFGAFLKIAGFQGLIFQGRAERWSYLLVQPDGSAELRDAANLLGLDTWETVEALAEELGKSEREIAVASIGPAGEHMAKWASVMFEKGHAAGHNGVGAVMGSKRLKAVVVLRGRPNVPVVDREKLVELNKQMIAPVLAAKGSIHEYGTLSNYPGIYATGSLPVRNYTTNLWEGSQEEFAKYIGPYIHEHFAPRRGVQCWACSNRHCQEMTIQEGPYAGTEIEEPEYEQLSAFSANVGIHDVASTAMLGNLIDRLGFETNEGGWIVSFTMECFERGILTKEDADGLEVRWGDAEAARRLLHMVARREGKLGDTLAEGVRRAAQRIGRGAEQVGVYTMKGATPRGHDHRARWPELFDTSISESGALDNTLMVFDLTQFGLPAKVDTFSPDAVAHAEGKMKGATQFEDSMVTCRFNSRTNVRLLTQMVSAVTAWDYGFEEAMALGRRAVNTMRVFNLRAGISPELDRPGPRYGSTPVDGPVAGKGIAPHFGAMLRQYYELMGWDEQGRPLPETLATLGLERMSRDLWGAK